MLRSIERLSSILDAGYEAFSESWLSQSAAIRELEILGEAAGRVSGELRRAHPEIEWTRMRGFSSFAKHEYWRVRPQLVWDAIVEMPRLRDRIKNVTANR